MHRRHLGEGAPSLGGEADDAAAAVARMGGALDEPFRRQRVDEAGDIAAGHHQARAELAHGEAVSGAVELRQEIEARQGGVEAAAQTRADLGLDEAGAGEKAQPDFELDLVVAAARRFAIGQAGQILPHGMSSPPAMTMDWPVTAAAAGVQSQPTAAATSSGVMRRRIGLLAASAARAASALFPVLAAIVAAA